MITPSYLFEAAVDDATQWPERYIACGQAISEYPRPYFLGESSLLEVPLARDVPIACLGAFSVSDSLTRSDFVDPVAVDSHGLAWPKLLTYIERSTEVFDRAGAILRDDSFDTISRSMIPELLHSKTKKDGRLFLGGVFVYMDLREKLLRSELIVDVNFARANKLIETYVEDVRNRTGVMSAGSLEVAAIDRGSRLARKLPVAVLTAVLANADTLGMVDNDMVTAIRAGVSRN